MAREFDPAALRAWVGEFLPPKCDALMIEKWNPLPPCERSRREEKLLFSPGPGPVPPGRWKRGKWVGPFVAVLPRTRPRPDPRKSPVFVEKNALGNPLFQTVAPLPGGPHPRKTGPEIPWFFFFSNSQQKAIPRPTPPPENEGRGNQDRFEIDIWGRGERASHTEPPLGPGENFFVKKTVWRGFGWQRPQVPFFLVNPRNYRFLKVYQIAGGRIFFFWGLTNSTSEGGAVKPAPEFFLGEKFSSPCPPGPGLGFFPKHPSPRTPASPFGPSGVAKNPVGFGSHTTKTWLCFFWDAKNWGGAQPNRTKTFAV